MTESTTGPRGTDDDPHVSIRPRLAQLWLFWLAPIAGALVAGWSYRLILGELTEPPTEPLAAKAAA